MSDTTYSIFNFLEFILRDFHIFIVVLILSFFSLYKRNLKMVTICENKKVFTKCSFMDFLHYFISWFVFLYFFKLAILPIRLIPFLVINILVVSFIFFGFIFKRCFFTIIQNKCLKCPENVTFEGKVFNYRDIKHTKKGYVSKAFINGNKSNLAILLLLSIKFIIEALITKRITLY